MTRVDAVMNGLRTFLTSVDQSPLPRTGDNAVPRLTEGWASLGIAAAMYDQGAWQTLVDAMGEAVGGDGTALMQLADQYADRNPGGQYAGNIMEVIYAVNCLDKADSSDLAERHRLAQESLKDAPTWGPFLIVELAAVRRLAGQGRPARPRRSPLRAPTPSSSSAPPATRPRPTTGRCGCETSSPTPR